jgi:hypothetical protein
MVPLRDIGVGSSALYCLTGRTLCCGMDTGGANRGVWMFDGVNVREDTTADIYFTRGFSSLHLNRRSSAMGPTGVYTCLIPNAGNALRALTVTITVGESNLNCVSNFALHV